MELGKIDKGGFGGLEKQKPCTIKGSREEVRRVIEEMNEKNPSGVQSAKRGSSP